jgi:hypothetical protein
VDTNWVQPPFHADLIFQYDANALASATVSQWDVQRNVGAGWVTILTNATGTPTWHETNQMAFFRVYGH